MFKKRNIARIKNNNITRIYSSMKAISHDKLTVKNNVKRYRTIVLYI